MEERQQPADGHQVRLVQLELRLGVQPCCLALNHALRCSFRHVVSLIEVEAGLLGKSLELD